MGQRKVCYRCGQVEDASIHRKDYGGGTFRFTGSGTGDGDGISTMETSVPYHGPTTHPYEPGILVEED